MQATIAWAAWILAVVSGAIGAVYTSAEQASGHPLLPQSPVSGIAGTAIAIAYGSVGLMLVLRRPGLIVGWLFLGIGVVAGVSNYAWGYVGLGGSQDSPPGPLAVIDVAWMLNALTFMAWASLAIPLLLLFPDGRPLDRSWRNVVAGAVVVPIVLALGLAIEPGRLRLFETFDNPYAVTGSLEPLVGIAIDLALAGLLALGGLAVWSLVLRYRRADAIERRQLRWFAWGGVLTMIGGVVIVLTALVAEADTRVVDLSWVLFAFASITLPVAALIAILRERLYDIDRLISRTFVFGLLTAILAGLYSALIRLFNALFVDVTGQSNEFALVLTTLILATTFTPIKKRLEEIADRRFRVPTDAAVSAPLSDEVPDLAPARGPSAGSMSVDDFDRRIEVIARRVARDVLAESRLASDGAAQDQDAQHHEDEGSEEVSEAGKPGPQA